MGEQDVECTGTRVPRGGSGRRHTGPAGGNPLLSTGVALALLALLLVIAGANTIGDLTAEPRFAVEEVQRPPIGPASPANPPAVEVAGEPDEEGTGFPEQFILFASVIAVAAGAALLIRTIVQNRFPDDDEDHAGEPADGDTGPDHAAAELNVFRNYFSDAQAALERSGDDSDAMIRCWLSLEKAAHLAGGGRRASQTPSEFTAAVLKRFHTDPADTDVVLRLYQRARYGVSPERAALTDSELRAAQQALRSMRSDIEQALSAPELPRRKGMP